MLLNGNDIVSFTKDDREELIFLRIVLKKSIFDRIDFCSLYKNKSFIFIDKDKYIISYRSVVVDYFNKKTSEVGFRVKKSNRYEVNWSKKAFLAEYMKKLLSEK